MRLVAALVTFATLPAAACGQDDYVSDTERLVAAIGLAAGDTVADIGAGRGELAVELARVVGPSGRVYATELDEDRLRELRRIADSAELRNISVIEAHATRTNLPEGCCDALVLRRVYHHIGDPRQMNESLRLSLRPGGFLAILDFAPDGNESSDPGGRDTGDQHGVTSATVVRELGEAGFEQVKVEEADRPSRYLVVGRRPQG
jgi:ubiquinone/menaquinone biosynthesis C-methylase UbiE